jgi:RimJ/RimL family protein N-acetyltransferase
LKTMSVGLTWRPARRPERVPLEGETVVLEPLEVDKHVEELYGAAAGAEATWSYLPYGPFATRDDFQAWLRWLDSDRDGLVYVVVPRRAGMARGIAAYMSIVPEHGVIEIGRIWLPPALQRTRTATEAIYLMCRHAFEDLGYRRLEWRCNVENAASLRAARRFGFVFEGVFRQHRVAKGRNRDTAWFSITDGEWPGVRAGFDAWLSADNFDASGLQRHSLSELRVRLSEAASEGH